MFIVTVSICGTATRPVVTYGGMDDGDSFFLVVLPLERSLLQLGTYGGSFGAECYRLEFPFVVPTGIDLCVCGSRAFLCAWRSKVGGGYKQYVGQ